MKPTKKYNGRSRIRMFNMDNREFMNQVEDNYYDLAICDPEYGIGANKEKPHNGWKDYGIKSWDDKPVSENQINEVIRVSKNQVLWGANYYPEYLNGSMGWIFWDKGQRNFSLSDGELAYTSFKKALRVCDYSRAESNREERIHATQKPQYLYRWILKNYAESNQKIFDGWGGSMSIAIACWDLGFDLDICELDTDYFNDAVKRFEQHIKQTQLF